MIHLIQSTPQHNTTVRRRDLRKRWQRFSRDGPHASQTSFYSLPLINFFQGCPLHHLSDDDEPGDGVERAQACELPFQCHPVFLVVLILWTTVGQGLDSRALNSFFSTRGMRVSLVSSPGRYTSRLASTASSSSPTSTLTSSNGSESGLASTSKGTISKSESASSSPSSSPSSSSSQHAPSGKSPCAECASLQHGGCS